MTTLPFRLIRTRPALKRISLRVTDSTALLTMTISSYKNSHYLLLSKKYHGASAASNLIKMNERHTQTLLGIFFPIKASLGNNTYSTLGSADTGIVGQSNTIRGLADIQSILQY